jgi:hypothetical protein
VASGQQSGCNDRKLDFTGVPKNASNVCGCERISLPSNNPLGYTDINMTQKQLQDFLQALQKVHSSITTREQAEQLLREEGVLAENGELAEPYR